MRRARGYTAVEVMLAIAVLGIGAAGVMSMQKSAIQGNLDARKIDMANAIARTWLERLRRDSATWTLPSESNVSSASNWSTNTVLIKSLGDSTNAGRFNFPTAYPSGTYRDGYSAAADILGRDVAPTSGTQKYPGAQFCTQIRIDWLKTDELLRATVRVYWLRELLAAPAGDFCNSDDAAKGPGSAAANTIYHFIYATSAVRRNPGR
jgi:prepilin-type N-terminal cleavage/methylation domain-containing protein